MNVVVTYVVSVVVRSLPASPWSALETSSAAFRSAFGSSLVVFAVEASSEIRWGRVQRRRRPDDPTSWQEFLRRDARERGWGLEQVVAAADLRIVNEGSLDDFYAAVRKALRRLDG